MAAFAVADDNLSNRFWKMFVSKFSCTCKACSIHSVCLELSLRRVCSGLLLYRQRWWISSRVCYAVILFALSLNNVIRLDLDLYYYQYYRPNRWLRILTKNMLCLCLSVT